MKANLIPANNVQWDVYDVAAGNSHIPQEMPRYANRSLTLDREYHHMWASRSAKSQDLVAKREAGEARIDREIPALPPQL